MNTKSKIHAMPLVLMVGIAGHQWFRAHVHDLTPWKGGGYGMFSTVDGGGNRVVRIEVISDGAVFPASVPRDSKLKLARNLPSVSGLDRYATWLSGQAWMLLQRRGREAPTWACRMWTKGQPVPEAVVVPDEVRLTVFRQIYDRKSGEARFEAIRTVSRPGAPLDAIERLVGASLRRAKTSWQPASQE